MSRSYKRTPICKDNKKSAKHSKRLANKTVRRKAKSDMEKVYNHSAYKKMYETWHIHDYISYWTENDARKWYREGIRDDAPRCMEYKTENEYVYRIWHRFYRRK